MLVSDLRVAGEDSDDGRLPLLREANPLLVYFHLSFSEPMMLLGLGGVGWGGVGW